jgi:hypothetical protein
MTHVYQVDVNFPLTLDLLENKRKYRINFLIAIAVGFLLILPLIEIT